MLDESLVGLGNGLHLWDPHALFGWLAAALKFLKRNTLPGQSYFLHRPRTAPGAKTGVDYFVLEEKPELWAECPDVFSHALGNIWRRDTLVERVASFLRAPNVPHVRKSSINHGKKTQGDAHKNKHRPAGEIILLDFSRNPKTFRDVLQECAELNPCRQEELPSGAHIFVVPEDFEDAMHAVEREGWTLKRRHVVVAQEFEEVVMSVVKKIASREQVRLKSRTVACFCDAKEEPQVQVGTPDFPKSQQASASEDGQERLERFMLFCVKRTFIHIPCADSIYSGPSSGPKTVSTSDANPRVLVHPRKL